MAFLTTRRTLLAATAQAAFPGQNGPILFGSSAEGDSVQHTFATVGEQVVRLIDDLLDISRKDLRALRGDRIGFVAQNTPLTRLTANAAPTVGTPGSPSAHRTSVG